MMLNMKIGDVFNEIPQELHYMEKSIIRIGDSDSLKLGYKIFRYPRYHGYNYLVFKSQLLHFLMIVSLISSYKLYRV